ncbi:cytochrome c oxidase subunit IV family [Gamsiella multidivaricata]|uniref:cytochrome c oxidase subunit IV family n=1 Tax=Gamsiella multidivaricata TaxID=101098 RepID=UPI00221EC054|nr:cytochrome c oxidase subunit IV family [Gamsiella multidivaricata]KAG0361884.1 Cytochrome c oxidase subunit 5A [Gamsiella multidivaricata]KAI7818604.1 cytochrome c oxidase subunit IV family [Gamsiella multidivaricata]
MIRTLVRPAVRATQRRCASTTAASPATLQNLETRWSTLSSLEQSTLAKQLEQVQAGDWTKMTLEQKKAAYWVAFGPHGARTPLTGPNHGAKVFVGTTAVVGAAGALFLWMRAGKEKPSTTTKEWQEASNEYARENKINPITGISSDNYKGPGFVSLTKN